MEKRYFRNKTFVILLGAILVLSAVLIGEIRQGRAEYCRSRDILGKSDIFWGNPPPLDYYKLPPRDYPDVIVASGGNVRLSLEGELDGVSDCTGYSVELEIYRDTNPVLVQRVTGNLLLGGRVIPGNLGTSQWYIDWPHNLPDGRYRFKLVRFNGSLLESILSTNVLIVINNILGSHWCETEGSWSGTWLRRGTTNTFDATWTSGASTVTGVLNATTSGANVTFRGNSPAGNCTYTGLISGANASGTYTCP